MDGTIKVRVEDGVHDFVRDCFSELRLLLDWVSRAIVIRDREMRGFFVYPKSGNQISLSFPPSHEVSFSFTTKVFSEKQQCWD